eukprot:jgi/Pico_ML_1/53489/g4025.t1
MVTACVWMHTPSQTSTSTTAPSLIRAAVDTSQQKSTCPGESTRFTSALSSGPSLDASLGACKSAMAVDFMVMPRCCSSSRLSKYRSFPRHPRMDDAVAGDQAVRERRFAVIHVR